MAVMVALPPPPWEEVTAAVSFLFFGYGSMARKRGGNKDVFVVVEGNGVRPLPAAAAAATFTR
jgi:hypothetical protein